MRHCLWVLAVFATVCASSLAPAAPAAWRPVLEDDFDRTMIGPEWRILRGDWRIERGRLHVTRIWPSDNNILCTRPMPRGDARAVVRVRLVPNASMQLSLRAGEYSWGGGGFPDAFSAFLRTGKTATEPVFRDKAIHLSPDTDYTIEMTLAAGRGTVAVNGKTLVEEAVPPARSEVNRQFYINCMPNGWVDSVRLYARPGARLALPLRANSPAQNRKATVYAKDLIDPGNPALGMQAAIDALPPNGGVVVLPAGEFLMRRHLRLRSGVTLRGQGYDKTVLRHAPIHETKVLKVEQEKGSCRVTVEDASKFRVGDAVCFGRSWSHVGGSDVKQPGRDHVITAVAGNVLTVRGTAPKRAGTIKNFFPLVFCVVGEYAEVKDLTLRGPASGPGGGGFNTCPVAFGCFYGARIHRVNVEGFPSDGVSVQFAGDALITDNTVSGTGAGFHPGTRTQRFLWARNLSVGNRTGLYFCFSNENGVFFQNTLDNFTGYPGVGDVFNLFAHNELKKNMGIGVGYAGLFFHNVMPALATAAAPTDPGRPLYFSAPHYYVFAENRLGKLVLGAGTRAIVLAGNRATNPGAALEIEGDTTDCVVARNDLNLARDLRLKVGVGRTRPVAPPALPAPILDGRDYYRPERPDCGFQRALDALAGKGGTLRLPGGRYPLRTALRLPARATLTGHGLGTVLYAADGYTGSLITGAGPAQIAVRDLTVLSRYDPDAKRAPAVALTGARRVHLEGVDIRGWEGVGVQIAGDDVTLRDCRAMGCSEAGYRLSGGRVRVNTSLARECGTGFVLHDIERSARIEGCIASGNRGSGIELRNVSGARVVANSAAFNLADGITLVDVSGGHVVANLCRANDQALRDRAGIHLAGATNGCTIAYNHCSDDQIHASQARGIVEETTARRNRIVANIACPFFMNHQPEDRPAPPALVAGGERTIVRDNLRRSVLPCGSSIESFALGFHEHPERITMRRVELGQTIPRLRSRLDNLEKRAKAAAEKSEALRSRIADLKEKPTPDSATLKRLQGQLARYENDRRQTARDIELLKARLQVPELSLRLMDAEKALRAAKFLLMRRRWDHAPPADIREAEAAAKAAEEEVAQLRRALESAESRLATLTKGKK